MHCKADVGFLERKTPMMFQQLETELPESISAVDCVVTIKKGINNYFQVPVVNQSKYDIVLRKNTNVGVIEYVKSVIPLQIKQSASCKPPSVNKATVIATDQILEEPSITLTRTNSEHQQIMVNTVDISGLTISDREREKVRAMLREESVVFAIDETDIGSVENNKMKIRLKDNIPCQATYNSLPRPVYQELKRYAEDLLNKQWMTNSHSEYSSLAVAVRKKGGTLRLCCDYRKLNAKTIPDCQSSSYTRHN